MRGLRSTIALLVVLAGLGAYIYFVASKAEDSSTKQEKLFPSIASDNIEELTVRNDAGETTTLKKADGKWTITAPVQARASDMDASGIANALAGLDVTRVVDENPADVKDYGLDKPGVEISFKSNGGKPSGKLIVGGKTATGGSLYARKDDEKRVVLIAEFNQTTFNKSTFDLRDKAIVSLDRSKVDGVDVVLDKGSFELAKKDADWSMVKPIVARADASAADGLVTAVESLQMKSIVGSSATPEELKRYGLDKPSAVVNLHLGSARASVLVGGPAGEDTVYVRDASKPDIFTVQKAAADDLRKVADDYRRKDLFDMRAFTATRIEITRAGTTTAWDKVKGTGDNAADTWKRVSPAAGEPDKEKFQAFVAALADIRAVSFVESKARTGLDAPAATIVVKFEEGKKEDRVAIAKPGTDAFASRPDDPGAARIDATKFDEAIKSIDEFTK
ncbi:MAG TPA: DUF4340 domain-containing protein [Aeromicrobium sp.]|nr:DUF4340 domain-containing protein [Aeromicrobium sp.]